MLLFVKKCHWGELGHHFGGDLGLYNHPALVGGSIESSYDRNGIFRDLRPQVGTYELRSYFQIRVYIMEY